MNYIAKTTNPRTLFPHENCALDYFHNHYVNNQLKIGN